MNETIIIGAYIQNKLNLCHIPSLEIIVFSNLALSAITNKVKNSIAKAKNINDIMLKTTSFERIDTIPIIKGTKVKTENPKTEPYPCIFSGRVVSAFVSPTENIPDNMQAQIA
nr:hypothetical protein [Clostridium simiarum]